MKRCVWLTVFSLTCVTRAWAVPTIDGNASVADGYGAALSVQDTNTQYGDAGTGDPVNGGGGSEIDQVFATVANGRLYVTIAGNLEWNFNKMNVFIDSKAGGVNSLIGANLPTMVDGYCCTIGGGTNLPNPADGALQRLNGLTFDAGFDADYFLAFTNGPETVNPNMPDSRQFWAAACALCRLVERHCRRRGTSRHPVCAAQDCPTCCGFPATTTKTEKSMAPIM